MSSKLFVAVFVITRVSSQDVYNKPINVFTCLPGGSISNIVASFSPCTDTIGCQLPQCCGVISGRAFNLQFIYQATKNVTDGGTVYGSFTGVLLYPPLGDPLSLEVATPLNIPSALGTALFGINPRMCDQTVCPQKLGNIYTINIPITVTSQIITTASVVAQARVQITDNQSGETIFCTTFYGRIMSPLFPLPLG